MIGEYSFPLFPRKNADWVTMEPWMTDRAIQIHQETGDRGGNERRLERRRELPGHREGAKIVSRVRPQRPLQPAKKPAIARRDAIAAMLARDDEGVSQRGCRYHCNAGNCLNTARVPSLHSLLSVAK